MPRPRGMSLSRRRRKHTLTPKQVRKEDRSNLVMCLDCFWVFPEEKAFIKEYWVHVKESEVRGLPEVKAERRMYCHNCGGPAYFRGQVTKEQWDLGVGKMQRMGRLGREPSGVSTAGQRNEPRPDNEAVHPG